MSSLDTRVQEIRHSSREMVRELGLLSASSTHDLPPSLTHALIELDLHGALYHLELASLLNLDKSTVSRIIKALAQKKLVLSSPNQDDSRYKRILLTPEGKKQVARIHQIANKRVNDALAQLPDAEQLSVTRGLSLYAKALKRSRMHNAFHLRTIQKSDNLELMMVIKKVLKEYGADRPGFAFVDAELENMHKAYSMKKHAYLVVERLKDNKIAGGGGFAPLAGGKDSVCEFRKMYFLPDLRGLGLGNALLQQLLSAAQAEGYKQCYLETLKRMDSAAHLYKKFGFISLDAPLGNTGHYGCDAWYIKTF